MPVGTLLFSLGFGVFSFLLYGVGLGIMALVQKTRVSHPTFRTYLHLLVVLLCHWGLTFFIHFLGNLQLQPATITGLLQLPYSSPWIALLTLPERLFLAWEVALILLCGRLATKTLGGRRGRRRLRWIAVALVALFGGERVVNLLFWGADPAHAWLELRSFWLSADNFLVLMATTATTVRLLASRRRAMFQYIGGSYRSLGWALAAYLVLIVGLGLVGLIPGDLLGALSQSVWYMLVVSVLLAILGLWNLIVGNRILSTSIEPATKHHLERGRKLTVYQLTEREQEIVWLLAEGLVNKEVANHLSVSESTVKNHIYNIYRKLGISNRGGLIKVLREAAG